MTNQENAQIAPTTNLEKQADIFHEIRHVKKRNKVTIIGFAPSWEEVKWGMDDMDYWGINELYMQAVGKRFDAWFEVNLLKVHRLAHVFQLIVSYSY